MKLNEREEKAFRFIRTNRIGVDQVRRMFGGGGFQLGLKDDMECLHLAAHLARLPHKAGDFPSSNPVKTEIAEPEKTGIWSMAQGSADKYN